MHKKQKNKITGIILVLLGLGTALVLSLTALNQTITFFYSPSDLLGTEKITPNPERAFRMGGLVKLGSINKRENGVMEFIVTDNLFEMKVIYNGIVPDLFREEQGVVATGKMDNDGNFIASELLAKHDEKYMPPEVSKALKKSAEKMGHPTNIDNYKSGDDK